MSENHQYAKLALWIGDKERLSDNDRDELATQVNDDAEIAQSIIDVAKVSMGQKISESDMGTHSVEQFTPIREQGRSFVRQATVSDISSFPKAISKANTNLNYAQTT